MNYRLLKYLNKKGVRKSTLKKSFLHRWTGGRISQPGIWSFTKSSVLKGWVIGSYAACNPFLGGQILMSLPFVFLTRANMFVVLALIFTTNPLTIGPFIYAAYVIGHAMLGAHAGAGPDADKMAEQLGSQGIWESLSHPSGWIMEVMLGCLVIATATALIGGMAIQFFWKDKPRRTHVVKPAAAGVPN